MGDSIGDMHDRVIIQKAAETDDNSGGATIAWNNVEEVWARIQPVSDSETIKNLALSENNLLKVRIRWKDDIGTITDADKFRLLWVNRSNQVLRIVGRINPDAQKRFLEITCRTGQDE